MAEKKQDVIDQRLHDLNNDGVDRRGFLKCMAWAGTGLVWTLSVAISLLCRSATATSVLISRQIRMSSLLATHSYLTGRKQVL